MIIAEDRNLHLLVEAGLAVCAIPLHQVRECMRPLPVEPLKDAPTFVTGLSIIRGIPTPVVDLGRIVRDIPIERPTRFVTVLAGERPMALSTSGVLGARAIPAADLLDLPTLLRDATADRIAGMGALDSRLLLLLRAGRLLPESFWGLLDPTKAGP